MVEMSVRASFLGWSKCWLSTLQAAATKNCTKSPVLWWLGNLRAHSMGWTICWTGGTDDCDLVYCGGRWCIWMVFGEWHSIKQQLVWPPDCSDTMMVVISWWRGWWWWLWRWWWWQCDDRDADNDDDEEDVDDDDDNDEEDGMNKVIQWGSRLERIEDSLSKQWRWVCWIDPIGQCNVWPKLGFEFSNILADGFISNMGLYLDKEGWWWCHCNAPETFKRGPIMVMIATDTW